MKVGDEEIVLAVALTSADEDSVEKNEKKEEAVDDVVSASEVD